MKKMRVHSNVNNNSNIKNNIVNNNAHHIKTMIGGINASNGFNIESKESAKSLMPYKK